jgi:hypothetical protein
VTFRFRALIAIVALTALSLALLVHAQECVCYPTDVLFTSPFGPLEGLRFVIDVNGSEITGFGAEASLVIPETPVSLDIHVGSWLGIPLNYNYHYVLTQYNKTMPIYVNIPAAELVITPVSASGMPLTTQALINVACDNHFVDSGVGLQVVVVPIPSSGSIMCNITGYSYGAIARKGVILTMERSGQVVPITLTVPVSGYYIPGIGFVPISMFIDITILLGVVIMIIIILIVILLIEYSNWRRRRIAKLLGPPG